MWRKVAPAFLDLAVKVILHRAVVIFVHLSHWTPLCVCVCVCVCGKELGVTHMASKVFFVPLIHASHPSVCVSYLLVKLFEHKSSRNVRLILPPTRSLARSLFLLLLLLLLLFPSNLFPRLPSRCPPSHSSVCTVFSSSARVLNHVWNLPRPRDTWSECSC